MAPIATTTAINVNGDTGNETLLIDLYSTVRRHDQLGNGQLDRQPGIGTGAAPDDVLFVDNSGGDDDATVTFGASGIDLNTDGDLDVTLAGVETTIGFGSAAGDDTFSGGRRHGHGCCLSDASAGSMVLLEMTR